MAEYTKTREQFGKPIATFQAVGQRAADAYVDAEAIRLTAWQAAWRIAEGLPADKEIAVAKFWAADGGQRVVHAAVHLHGGVGVDREYPLHRFFLNTKHIELTLGGATDQLLRLGATSGRRAGLSAGPTGRGRHGVGRVGTVGLPHRYLRLRPRRVPALLLRGTGFREVAAPRGRRGVRRPHGGGGRRASVDGWSDATGSPSSCSTYAQPGHDGLGRAPSHEPARASPISRCGSTTSVRWPPPSSRSGAPSYAPPGPRSTSTGRRSTSSTAPTPTGSASNSWTWGADRGAHRCHRDRARRPSATVST